jgi:tetratricopeptide (TPR) repeat protein
MSSDDRASGSDRTVTVTAALDMLPPGARLADRYRIIGISGAGGMGVVYHAHDEQLDIEVALKLLRPERGVDERAVERFRQEIRFARQVSHPNVVRIHDIGRDGDVVFFSMDHVEGRTLRELLADGPLSPARAIGIARQLAEGLSAAHASGVVHRDLKPANVLVADDGHAWVTDFGIARAAGVDGLTREGAVIGTADYLSPEQVRGGSIDGRADIYALGLVLCEMLTGEVPLRGDTLEETAARRAVGRVTDLGRQGARIPRGLRRIITRCLAPRPEDRYADAGELVRDLEQGGAGLRLAGALRRAGAVAGLVVVLGGAWWLLPGPTPEPGPADVSHIAVLPLANDTGRADYEWVKRGLAESLAAGLAESPELRVVDSLRVFRTLEALRLTDEPLDARQLRQLAELLEVSRVVTGRVIGDGQDLRLELSLRRLPDGELQRLSLSPGAAGLLRASDEGVVRLHELLQLRRSPEAPAPALSASVAAMTAYDEGVSLLARGQSVRALEPLAAAVKEDPAFGLGWSALAEAYADAGYHDRALDAADQALALLEPQGGRAARQARARRAMLAGDLQRGLELLEGLVERFPNDTGARTRLAEVQGELGRFGAARETLLKVTELDPSHPRAWFLLGKFAVMSGDARVAADDYLVRALVIQNRLGSDQGQGEVLNAMGIAREHLGDLSAARQLYQRAAERREAAGDRRGLAGSLANLARLDMILGDFDAARRDLEAALALREEIGDSVGVADLRNEFGVLEEEAGDYAATLEHYREALRLRLQFGGGRVLAESYTNVAFAYLMLGEYDNAAAFARNALEGHEAADNPEGRIAVLEIEGALSTVRGDWDGALRAYLQSLELSRELGHPFSEAAAEGGLGRVARHQGRPEAALEAWERALEILEPLRDSRGLTEFHLRRAALFLSLYLPEAAAEALDAAERWMPAGGNLAQRAEYQRLLGELAVLEGRPDEARAYFAEAASLAGRTGSAALGLEVELSRLRWLGPDPQTNPQRLASRAERLGHAPMRLEALELLAEAHLAEGRADLARGTARQALRPPLRLEPWSGNWRLYWLLAEAARDIDPDESEAARRRAADLLGERLEALAEPRRRGLASRPEAEALRALVP